jgi:hypothetical protein
MRREAREQRDLVRGFGAWGGRDKERASESEKALLCIYRRIYEAVRAVDSHCAARPSTFERGGSSVLVAPTAFMDFMILMRNSAAESLRADGEVLAKKRRHV